MDREQGDRCKQGPWRGIELGRYTEDEAFMASGAGIHETDAGSAGVMESGTGGRHELRWLQDPQVVEGAIDSTQNSFIKRFSGSV